MKIFKNREPGKVNDFRAIVSEFSNITIEIPRKCYHPEKSNKETTHMEQ